MGIFTRDKEDKSGGSQDHRTAKKKKNIIKKAADKSLTVKLVKKISKGIKQASENIKKVKQSDSLLGTSDYQGDPLGRPSKVIKDTTPKDDGGDDRRNTTMVASTPTSQLQKAAVKAAPVGPTVADIGNVEETEEQRLLRIKRKGRRATKLAADEDELNLSKKALLG
jgi:hypothetical protein